MGEFSSVEILLKTQNLKLKDVTYFHDITFCSTYTKEKIPESSPEFEVVSVLKRNLARPFFFSSFNDSLSHFGGRRRR